jgi:hypothetical protein
MKCASQGLSGRLSSPSQSAMDTQCGVCGKALTACGACLQALRNSHLLLLNKAKKYTLRRARRREGNWLVLILCGTSKPCPGEKPAAIHKHMGKLPWCSSDLAHDSVLGNMLTRRVTSACMYVRRLWMKAKRGASDTHLSTPH